MTRTTKPGEGGSDALTSPLPRPVGSSANAGGGADSGVETHALPDVSADRDAPAAAAGSQESLGGKPPPLEIKQIEDLEEDALGG